MAVFPLLADEEEELVLLRVPLLGNIDRAADRVAEIVEPQRIHLAREKGAGVEDVVADELEQRAVVALRAALGYDVNQCTRAPAEFRAIARRQDLHLGDRVRAGIDRGIRVAAIVHVLRAVHVKRDGVRANAVDALSGGGKGQPEGIERGRHGARNQAQQLRVVAAIQRDLAQLPAADDPRHIAGRGLHLFHRRRHGNRFRHGAHFQSEVDAPPRGGIQNDAGLFDRAKPFLLGANRVGAPGSPAKTYRPPSDVTADAFETGLRVGGGHGAIGHGCARRVAHLSGDLTDVGLSPCQPGCRREDGCKSHQHQSPPSPQSGGR